jgi:hypothetical protein
VNTDAHIRELRGRLAKREDRRAWDVQTVLRQVELRKESFDIANVELELALRDYLAAEEAYRELMHREVGVYRLTPEEIEVMDRFEAAMPLLALRMETFVSQARILMDRIARLLHFAFRPAKVEIGSHSGVAKHLPALAATHRVPLPDTLVPRAARLSVTVKKLRDKHLFHPSGQHGHKLRTVPIVDPKTGAAKLKIKWAAPPDEEPVEPEYSNELQAMRADVLDYLGEVLTLIESNELPQPAGSGDQQVPMQTPSDVTTAGSRRTFRG